MSFHNKALELVLKCSSENIYLSSIPCHIEWYDWKTYICVIESDTWHTYWFWLVDLPLSSIGRVLDCHARGPGFKLLQRQNVSLLHLFTYNICNCNCSWINYYWQYWLYIIRSSIVVMCIFYTIILILVYNCYRVQIKSKSTSSSPT